eukprot:scaffold40900_cov27-Phaeocystis_antarctica.AAC.1
MEVREAATTAAGPAAAAAAAGPAAAAAPAPARARRRRPHHHDGLPHHHPRRRDAGRWAPRGARQQHQSRRHTGRRHGGSRPRWQRDRVSLRCFPALPWLWGRGLQRDIRRRGCVIAIARARGAAAPPTAEAAPPG